MHKTVCKIRKVKRERERWARDEPRNPRIREKRTETTAQLTTTHYSIPPQYLFIYLFIYYILYYCTIIESGFVGVKH